MSKRKQDDNFHYIAEVSTGFGFTRKRGRLRANKTIHSENVHVVPDPSSSGTPTTSTAFAPTIEETSPQELTFTLDEPDTSFTPATKVMRGITVSHRQLRSTSI